MTALPSLPVALSSPTLNQQQDFIDGLPEEYRPVEPKIAVRGGKHIFANLEAGDIYK